MILLTNLAFLLAAFISKAAKHWRRYYETVLFVSFMNLLYNLLCEKRMVWSYHPDLLLSHKMADLMNTFVLLPSATILYLYFIPADKSKKLLFLFYYISWIALFSLIEYVWFRNGIISYAYGWTFNWSILFYFVMFYVIAIHAAKRWTALGISFAFTCMLVIVFKIPLGE